RFAFLSVAIPDFRPAPFRYRVLRKPFRRLLLFQVPYSIFFSIEPDHIHIIAVAHSKRKPGYWLKRS
ncbi:type II toxin-antitoxin system RelE/ParE family toxin, partial [bacterium]|nr:type II toxin-antitoxin system RelE/ParE family toxin [bacterium]